MTNQLRLGLVAVLAACSWVSAASAQTKHYRFAYEQPHSTGFGIAADVFAAKLAQASHGTMVIDQFPSAQLGTEPQELQLVKSGNIDFTIVSTANSATLSPEAGVLSLHLPVPLGRSHPAARAVADPQAGRRRCGSMYDETVTGVHALRPRPRSACVSMYGNQARSTMPRRPQPA